MNEGCAFCGSAPEANIHNKGLVGAHGHDYAPPTLTNRLRALARTFGRNPDTTSTLLEAVDMSVKAQRWDELKSWLRNVTTNGKMADDHVSAMEDLVSLIERGDESEEGEEKLTGRALLDKAREQRRAVLSAERYTVVEKVIHPSGTDQKMVRAGIEVEGMNIGGETTIVSGSAADVDEWLDGRVTLEELGNRWRSKRN
jgi:hypothetical protein